MSREQWLVDGPRVVEVDLVARVGFVVICWGGLVEDAVLVTGMVVNLVLKCSVLLKNI